MKRYIIGLTAVIIGLSSCKSSANLADGPKSSYDISFNGQAHDPGWNVNIGPKSIVYTSMLNQEGYTFFDIQRNPIFDLAGMAYSGSDSHGNKISVQVFKQDCKDVVMQKTWPFKVEVQLEVSDGQEPGENGLSGFGEYIEDKRLNGIWYVQTFNGKEITVFNSEKPPVLQFDTQKNTIAANLGCNAMIGSYELMENRIYFSDKFNGTLIYCEGIVDLENSFSKAVSGKSVRYTFRNNRLILTSLNGEEFVTLTHKK
jgi:heat shock protein HslJ